MEEYTLSQQGPLVAQFFFFFKEKTEEFEKFKIVQTKLKRLLLHCL